jgi:hypothetical protein
VVSNNRMSAFDYLSNLSLHDLDQFLELSVLPRTTEADPGEQISAAVTAMAGAPGWVRLAIKVARCPTTPQVIAALLWPHTASSLAISRVTMLEVADLLAGSRSVARCAAKAVALAPGPSPSGPWMDWASTALLSDRPGTSAWRLANSQSAVDFAVGVTATETGIAAVVERARSEDTATMVSTYRPNHGGVDVFAFGLWDETVHTWKGLLDSMDHADRPMRLAAGVLQLLHVYGGSGVALATASVLSVAASH